MSLFHAKHAKHAKSDDAQDGPGLLTALALMRSRDAIVGTEDLTGQIPAPPTRPQVPWLARLDPDDRRAILRAELTEDLSVTQPDADSVAVLCRVRADAPTLEDMARFRRPRPDQFRDALPMVGHYAELRPDRAPEIEVQTRALMPFFAAIQPLEPARHPALIEVLDLAMDLTTAVVMRVKLALACPRPTRFSEQVQPMIACPTHPTLPSGHATQAFCLAALLTRLPAPQAELRAQDQLMRLACRIAVNRTVAGVHFPADSAAGAVLGLQLAHYLLARGGVGPDMRLASFDGTRFHDATGPRDFHYGIVAEMLACTDPAVTLDGAPVRPRLAPQWSTLVERARGECDDR